MNIGVRLSGEPQYLKPVAQDTGVGGLKAFEGALARKAQAGQALEAGCITKTIRAPDLTA